MNRCLRLTMAAAVLLKTMLLPVSAEVVVEDDFSSGVSLKGCSPTKAPPGVIWLAPEGERTIMTDGGSARVRLAKALSAVLEVGLDEPGRYALSMEVEFPLETGSGLESWVALGFSEGRQLERAFNNSGEAGGSPWMLFRWRGSAQVFAGKGVARPLGKPTEARYMPGRKHHLKLVLDTREESWTLEASVNEEPLRIGRSDSAVFTFPRNPTIRYIGFSAFPNQEGEPDEGDEVQIRNFRLERETEELSGS